MTSASLLLWQAIGSPPAESCIDLPFGSRCWQCGAPTSRGLEVQDWMGSNYTSQNRTRSPAAEHVCEACVFICSRTSPVPGREAKEGKKFGGNYRNYSHLYDAGRYLNASKGEKPAILAFLRGPKVGPWFAAIADSGQKHVIPWTPVNLAGRGRVMFDETEIALPNAEGWALVDDMAALLTAGATKEEIAEGTYGPRVWTLCREQMEAFEARWGGQRGPAWFALALWLAQRDEAQVAERLEAEKQAKAEAKARAKAPRAAKPAKDKAPSKRGKKTKDAAVAVVTEETSDAGTEAEDGGDGATAGGPGGLHAGDAERVPEGGGEPAEALGSAPEPDAQRGGDDLEHRGVGDGLRERPQPPRAVQLGLF